MPSWKDKLYQAEPVAASENDELAAWKAKLYSKEQLVTQKVVEEEEDDLEDQEEEEQRPSKAGRAGATEKGGKPRQSGSSKEKAVHKTQKDKGQPKLDLSPSEAHLPPGKQHINGHENNDEGDAGKPGKRSTRTSKTVRIKEDPATSHASNRDEGQGGAKRSESTRKDLKSALKGARDGAGSKTAKPGFHSLLQNKTRSLATFQVEPADFDAHLFIEQQCQDLSERGVEGVGTELAALKEYCNQETQSAAAQGQEKTGLKQIRTRGQKQKQSKCVYEHHREFLAASLAIPELDEKVQAQQQQSFGKAGSTSRGGPLRSISGLSPMSFLNSFSGPVGPSFSAWSTPPLQRLAADAASRGLNAAQEKENRKTGASGLESIMTHLFSDLKVAAAERDFDQAQILVEELGAVLEEARSSPPELRFAASALSRLIGEPAAAHRLLACHSLKVEGAQQRLMKHHSSVAGDEDSLEYAANLAQRTFLQIGLAADDVMVIFGGSQSAAHASIFVQWAAKEAARCSQQLCNQVLAPFGDGSGLKGPVACAHALFIGVFSVLEAKPGQPPSRRSREPFLGSFSVLEVKPGALLRQLQRIGGEARSAAFKEVQSAVEPYLPISPTSESPDLDGTVLKAAENVPSYSTEHVGGAGMANGEAPSYAAEQVRSAANAQEANPSYVRGDLHASLQSNNGLASLEATASMLSEIRDLASHLLPLAGPRFTPTLVPALLEVGAGLAGGAAAALKHALSHADAKNLGAVRKMVSALHLHLSLHVFQEDLPQALSVLVERCGQLLIQDQFAALATEVAKLDDTAEPASSRPARPPRFAKAARGEVVGDIQARQADSGILDLEAAQESEYELLNSIPAGALDARAARRLKYREELEETPTRSHRREDTSARDRAARGAAIGATAASSPPTNDPPASAPRTYEERARDRAARMAAVGATAARSPPTDDPPASAPRTYEERARDRAARMAAVGATAARDPPTDDLPASAPRTYEERARDRAARRAAVSVTADDPPASAPRNDDERAKDRAARRAAVGATADDEPASLARHQRERQRPSQVDQEGGRGEHVPHRATMDSADVRKGGREGRATGDADADRRSRLLATLQQGKGSHSDDDDEPAAFSALKARRRNRVDEPSSDVVGNGHKARGQASGSDSSFVGSSRWNTSSTAQVQSVVHSTPDGTCDIGDARSQRHWNKSSLAVEVEPVVHSTTDGIHNMGDARSRRARVAAAAASVDHSLLDGHDAPRSGSRRQARATSPTTSSTGISHEAPTPASASAPGDPMDAVALARQRRRERIEAAAAAAASSPGESAPTLPIKNRVGLSVRATTDSPTVSTQTAESKVYGATANGPTVNGRRAKFASAASSDEDEPIFRRPPRAVTNGIVTVSYTPDFAYVAAASSDEDEPIFRRPPRVNAVPRPSQD
eukprot:gene24009-9582_t